MGNKVLITIFIAVFCISSVLASDFSGSIFYSGDLSIKLDKDSYKPGETIRAEIILYNAEKYPLPDGFLTIEAVQGGKEPVYPSQISDRDNIFYEKVFKDIAITPLGSMRVVFEYQLPSNLKGGDYRLDAFFTTRKTPIVGIAHILLPGRSAYFRVIGNGDFPKAKILRTKTWILNDELIGPTGPAADAGAENVKGRVYFQDIEQGSVLNVKVCEWDDTTCSNFIYENDYAINTNAAFQDYSFPAPQTGDAYAVRLEVLKDRILQSLYRSRVVITGDAVTLRKIAIDRLYLKKDEEATIKVLLFGSPDHYNYPIVKGTSLKVSVKDLESNLMIFEESRKLPDLDSASLTLTEEDFKFTPTANTNKFEVCAEAFSQAGLLIEDYCYVVDISKFNLEDYDVTLDYSYLDDILDIKLCAVHGSGAAISTKIEYSLMLGSNPALIKKLDVNGCASDRIRIVEKGQYNLIANDLGKNKQYSFSIDISGKGATDMQPAGNKPDASNIYIIALISIAIIIIALIARNLAKKGNTKGGNNG